MLSKEEILEKMRIEMPFHLPERIKPYIEEAMEIYANQWPEMELDRKMKWLEVPENQKLVPMYFASKEVAEYIRATHTYISPCFYLLPSGDLVRLISDGFLTINHK